MSAGRVLHVVVPEPAGEVGGAELHVLDLAIAQQRDGRREPFVVTTEAPEYQSRLHEAGVPFATLRYPRLARRDLVRLQCLPESEHASVVHAHGYDCNYIAAVLRARFGGWSRLPFVVTSHGWLSDTPWHRAKTALDLLVCRRADAIIVCSADQLGRCPRTRPRRRFYIPNGVPPGASEPPDPAVAKRLLGLRTDGFVVAAVGRLAKEKRLSLYLETCRRVATERADVQFLVVGGGPDRARLELLVDRLKLADRVVFTGLIRDMEVPYAAADLLLHTSAAEATSRVVLEAMARAIPVVAVPVGGTGDLVKHGRTGLLVPPDPRKLARETLSLLGDPSARKRLGDRAMEIFAAEFSIAAMRNRIDAVYDEVTGYTTRCRETEHA